MVNGLQKKKLLISCFQIKCAQIVIPFNLARWMLLVPTELTRVGGRARGASFLYSVTMKTVVQPRVVTARGMWAEVMLAAADSKSDKQEGGERGRRSRNCLSW